MFKDFNKQFSEQDSELFARFTGFMKKVVVYAHSTYEHKTKYKSVESLFGDFPETLLVHELDLETLLQNEHFHLEKPEFICAFYGLSSVQQKILELTFINQLTGEEIANRLNSTVKYVYNQRAIAIKKLRDLLK